MTHHTDAQRTHPAPISTGRLVLAMIAKGGLYIVLSLLVWPVAAVALTGATPLGPNADRLAGVFAMLAASFAAAGALAFLISRPRVRHSKLRNAMTLGLVVAALAFLTHAYAAYDVISRNLPAASPTSTSPARAPENPAADATLQAQPTEPQPAPTAAPSS